MKKKSSVSTSLLSVDTCTVTTSKLQNQGKLITDETKGTVLDDGKELWLFRLPKGFNPSHLDKKSLTLKDSLTSKETMTKNKNEVSLPVGSLKIPSKSNSKSESDNSQHMQKSEKFDIILEDVLDFDTVTDMNPNEAGCTGHLSCRALIGNVKNSATLDIDSLGEDENGKNFVVAPAFSKVFTITRKAQMPSDKLRLPSPQINQPYVDIPQKESSELRYRFLPIGSRNTNRNIIDANKDKSLDTLKAKKRKFEATNVNQKDTPPAARNKDEAQKIHDERKERKKRKKEKKEK